MLDFDISLENENVLLRPMYLDDIEEFVPLTSDQSLWQYFVSDLSVRAELQEWLNLAIQEREQKNRIPFTIVDKTGGEIIGTSSFGNISLRDSRIEIGWTWLGRQYHGRGFNPQVKYLMLKHGFETLGLERIEVKTDVLNLAARKALEKIGCIEEGVLRSHTLMTHNRRRDTIYYSILKSEWPGVKKKNKWI